MKQKTAVVTVLFTVDPGGLHGSLEHWIEHVNKALEAYRYNGEAPACYADFEVVNAALLGQHPAR